MRLWGALLTGLVACGNRTELDGLDAAASSPTVSCSDKHATRLSQDLVWASEMSVDATDLYFMTTYPAYKLERVPKTGGESTVLAEQATSFVIDANRIYYSTIVGTDGAFTIALSSLSKTGGVPSVLASGAFSVEDLVADESTLYFVGGAHGPIVALPKSGGLPTPGPIMSIPL